MAFCYVLVTGGLSDGPETVLVKESNGLPGDRLYDGENPFQERTLLIIGILFIVVLIGAMLLVLIKATE